MDEIEKVFYRVKSRTLRLFTPYHSLTITISKPIVLVILRGKKLQGKVSRVPGKGSQGKVSRGKKSLYQFLPSCNFMLFS